MDDFPIIHSYGSEEAIRDCILAVRANRGGEPPLVLEHTAAGTVWIMPNDLGGMTVMKPEDY
jgi:hypothetical protein